MNNMKKELKLEESSEVNINLDLFNLNNTREKYQIRNHHVTIEQMDSSFKNSSPSKTGWPYKIVYAYKK